MTDIYLHFIFSHYGLYGNAPVGRCPLRLGAVHVYCAGVLTYQRWIAHFALVIAGVLLYLVDTVWATLHADAASAQYRLEALLAHLTAIMVATTAGASMVFITALPSLRFVSI